MKKVLIVEDDAILAIVHRQYVKMAGHDVVDCVATGEEAIEAVKKYNPDLVLMDIQIIGEIDGIEAMQEIRKFSRIPVIYVTGNSDPRAKSRAELTGFVAFLIKPINEHILKESIDNMMQIQNN